MDKLLLEKKQTMKAHYQLSYPEGSIYKLIENTANKYPSYTAYNYFGKKTSYFELMGQIEACAKSLKTLGILEDECVTICMPNTPEALICFYALNKIGAVANMIHPLSSQKEIQYYLEASKSRMILTIDLAMGKIKPLIHLCDLHQVVRVSVKDSMGFSLGLLYNLTQGRKIPKVNDDKVMTWKRFIRLGQAYQKPTYVEIDRNQRAVILYSGGTTSNPKGIVLSNINFNALAIQGIKACQCLEAKDKVLVAMPVFHGFGLGICIHTTLYHGMTAQLIPKFNSKKFHQLMKKYKPNIIAGVPVIYEAMLRNNHFEGVDLSFVKCAISGGDSLSVSLKYKVDAFFEQHHAHIQLREGYGLTECVTGSSLMPMNTYRENSIGLPYPDIYFKIVKPDTCDEVPREALGEIAINSPTVMMGYLNDDAQTKRVLRSHEDHKTWLHTGDLGYMDEDGFIYFKQRIQRVVVSSAYNIYPQDIENILDSHPAVLTSAVIGMPHEYKKEVPVAFVILKDQESHRSSDILQELKDLCKENIAVYALPAKIIIKETLPKTLVGKIAYNKLKTESIGCIDEN